MARSGGAECRGAEVSGGARGDPRWCPGGGGGEPVRRLASGGASMARRYEDQGLAGLADRSRRPPRCSHQMDPAIEVWVLETRRRNPDWGPRRLIGRFGLKDTEVLFDRICRGERDRSPVDPPRSPTTTGKIERFHRTLRSELLPGGPSPTSRPPKPSSTPGSRATTPRGRVRRSPGRPRRPVHRRRDATPGRCVGHRDRGLRFCLSAE